jgi:purine-nucleoside phosphorylase
MYKKPPPPSTTPHNNAQVGEIADVVLMPGDPERAKLIASTFLTSVKLCSNVRSIPVYTGLYKGIRITIMPHGMGIPSAGIYTYELYNTYKVKTIIRIGTCGAYKKDIKIGTLFAASESFSDTPYAKYIGVKSAGVLKCSKNLLNDLKLLARRKKTHVNVGRVHCVTNFYTDFGPEECYNISNAKVVEMESYAIYANAIKFHANALAILICTDNIANGKHMNANQRTHSVSELIKIGLELAIMEAKKIKKNNSLK